MKKRIVIVNILLIVSLLSQAQSTKLHWVKTTMKVDTTTNSYCWKTIPAIAYSYINKDKDLKWEYISDTSKFYKVAIRSTHWDRKVKMNDGKWHLSTEFTMNTDSFMDLDIYYLDGKRIYPVYIKLIENHMGGYTGHFNELP